MASRPGPEQMTSKFTGKCKYITTQRKVNQMVKAEEILISDPNGRTWKQAVHAKKSHTIPELKL